MNCDWKQDGEDSKGRAIFRCQRTGCKNAIYAQSAEKCHATCRAFATSDQRIGDALEDFLASYGITKEWYVEFKEKHGLPPNCGCASRQEWLNKTSDAHPTIANFGVKLLTALTRKK